MGKATLRSCISSLGVDIHKEVLWKDRDPRYLTCVTRGCILVDLPAVLLLGSKAILIAPPQYLIFNL